MKSKILLIIIMIMILGSLPLFAEEPPIKSNSGSFSFKDAITYNEQDGWAYSEDDGIIHYWLYETYKYHDGDIKDIVDKYIPKWIEAMGYVIDFDYMYRISPNKNVAYSVRALMEQRGCDVSVAIITSGTYPHVIIHRYDKRKDYYWTDIIPLINTNITYTVVFNTNGGSNIAKQIVNEGNRVNIPLAPKKDGYVFVGWYIDVDLVNLFSFYERVTDNMTLYAKWVKTHSVIFNTNGGSYVANKTVTDGDCIEIPTSPSKDGYSFDGWYNDINLTQIFSFDTRIKENLVLYAKWKLITHTVTFNTNGGSYIAKQIVYEGNHVILPITPKKDGYVFAGWYNDPNLDEEFSSSTGIINDITLYAKWRIDVNHRGVGTKIGELHSTVTYLPQGTDGTAGTSATYVYFGDWPQTIKASDVTIDANRFITMGDFIYYEGSDGCYYVKCLEKPYATNYIYSYNWHDRTTVYVTYSDGTKVTTGGKSYKYFRVEPIKWRVLTNDYNGKKLLLAESILTSDIAYYDYSRTVSGKKDVNRIIEDIIVYPNNYNHSKIRAYLNGLSYTVKKWDSNSQEVSMIYENKGFLQCAFTDDAQALIATTVVDNSPASMIDSSAAMYACENTYDKIFLLSTKEVCNTEFGFCEGLCDCDSRIIPVTDYAKANNFETGITCNVGEWWLRSPYSDSYAVYRVLEDGWAGYGEGFHPVVNSSVGIVPALCLENNITITTEQTFEIIGQATPTQGKTRLDLIEDNFNWTDGIPRKLIYPIMPNIQLSEESKQKLESNLSLTVSFMVNEGGDVPIGSIRISPPIPWFSVTNDIQQYIARSWHFESSGTKSMATFKYNIIIE